MPRRPRPRPFAVLLLTAALPLAACGGVADEEESANPIEEIGTEVDGGNPGPDEAVNEDVKITALQLAYPEDGMWAEGAEVPLYAAIANTGIEPVQLVDVVGEDFADARLIGTDGAEGALVVAGDDNLYLEPPGPPSVLLIGLETSLRSSQSIPVTFMFDNGAEVTLDAPVSADPPGEGGFTAPEDPTPGS